MTRYDNDLLRFTAQANIHGAGAYLKIGDGARRLGGERGLVATDPGIIDAGWIDVSLKYRDMEDLKYEV